MRSTGINRDLAFTFSIAAFLHSQMLLGQLQFIVGPFFCILTTLDFSNIATFIYITGWVRLSEATDKLL